MKTVLILVAVALATLDAAPGASAAVGAWANGSKAKARILTEGIGPDGRLAAGLEIVLPTGWKTYWRDPGTAGVAPRFDFASSQNIARADVAFPVPHRFDDGYSVTNVYEERVILPLSVALADPAKPVELSAVLDLGVCQTVCVPDHIEAHLTVSPSDADAATGKILAAARALVPGPAEPGAFAVESVTRNGGTEGRPVFRVTAMVPAGAKAELFIEGPDDWSPYAPVPVATEDGRATYDVKFSRTGARTPIAGARFRVTISAGGHAIEQTIGLD